jgi:tetratricopeptide (TPR) repeat protein
MESKPGEETVPLYMLRSVYTNFEATGYPDMAKKIAEELLMRYNDSIGYWLRMNNLAFYFENDKSLNYLHKALKKDTNNVFTLSILRLYTVMKKDYSNAYDYLNRLKESTEYNATSFPFDFDKGYILMKNGFEKEAEIQFNGAIAEYKKQIELNLPDAQKYISHSILAYIYSAIGEKEKALEYLTQTINRETIPWFWIFWLKELPMLDNIRSEPEYLKILADYTSKYQKEHDRVGELLKEYGEIE